MEGKTESTLSAFTPKILCILFIILQLSNLVICHDPDDDSLENALEFVERRQRDLELQDNEYYGQPEDIGYGYQKNFGIFDNGPARELGSPDSDPDGELLNFLANYEGSNKRKSGVRERYPDEASLVSSGRDDDGDTESDIRCSYTRTLKDLWCRFRQSRAEDVNIEDLSPDQVAEILNSLYDKGGDETDSYDGSIFAENPGYDAIPLRTRRNYRVFDNFNKKKRYPSFGEGFYGKRSPSGQHLNYETPSQNEFLYALKFINPEINREAVESLKDAGYDVLDDDKDRDVLRILNDANPRPVHEEPYWMKTGPSEEVWLPGPVAYPSDDSVQDVYDSDKRAGPKIFKPHNGIHLNNKRVPVKRSPARSKKEANNEKVSKELKGIFEGPHSTTEPPKKKETKKPTEVPKKSNATKPEVTKHRDVKKLVRRANDYTKEKIYPINKNSEIEKIFNVQKVDKKSIDWSQYFGYDKRSEQWLKDDAVRRAENLFLAQKANQMDKSRYEAPFDTRIFNSKRKLSYNMDKNIDRMERKLGNIEEKIIDDAVKYTGAHIGGPTEDMRKVKSEIVHHLEAAYSLEKMKNALEEFKNSMKSEKNFRKGEEPKKTGSDAAQTGDSATTTVRSESSKSDKGDNEKMKRVSTKKEIEDVYGKDNLDFLNWPTQQREGGSSDGSGDSNEDCPVLEKSLNNCLRVSDLSPRFSDLLLPICSLQQICYLCGPEVGFSKPSACDLMYLTEAENLCQGNRACLVGARDSMLALRDIHEQELMSGESNHLTGSCLYNPCIQKYFMNAPGAVVPLEF